MRFAMIENLTNLLHLFCVYIHIEYFCYSIMIETLISSKTRVKLLMKFFLNSKNTGYLRNLEEEFGESSNAIRQELNKFEKAGFLDSFLEGNKKLFTVNIHHPLYSEINRMMIKITGLDHIIDYIVQRIGALQKVYLVGKLSQGQNTDIIDLILVGDNLNKPFLLEQIEKAEKKTDKKIRYIHYKITEFEFSKIKEPGINPLLLWSKD